MRARNPCIEVSGLNTCTWDRRLYVTSEPRNNIFGTSRARTHPGQSFMYSEYDALSTAPRFPWILATSSRTRTGLQQKVVVLLGWEFNKIPAPSTVQYFLQGRHWNIPGLGYASVHLKCADTECSAELKMPKRFTSQKYHLQRLPYPHYPGLDHYLPEWG